MSELVKNVFSFLEGLVQVFGDDARKIAAYCEENKVLSTIINVLEAIGLCLLDAIKALLTPPPEKAKLLLRS